MTTERNQQGFIHDRERIAYASCSLKKNGWTDGQIQAAMDAAGGFTEEVADYLEELDAKR